MYNPHQFDNSANVGPSALAVCLKSMIFLLMLVVMAGLGYWVWWLKEHSLAPPAFKQFDVVWVNMNLEHPHDIAKVMDIRLDLSNPEKMGYKYELLVAGGVNWTTTEENLEPAAAGGEMEFQQSDEKVRQMNRTEREMKAGNLHEQWEQDGRGR